MGVASVQELGALLPFMLVLPHAYFFVPLDAVANIGRVFETKQHEAASRGLRVTDYMKRERHQQTVDARYSSISACLSCTWKDAPCSVCLRECRRHSQTVSSVEKIVQQDNTTKCDGNWKDKGCGHAATGESKYSHR